MCYRTVKKYSQDDNANEIVAAYMVDGLIGRNDSALPSTSVGGIVMFPPKGSETIRKEKAMDTTTLIIIIVVLVLLFGGGGFWYRSRRG